jgi:DNA replication protein DnaC
MSYKHSRLTRIRELGIPAKISDDLVSESFDPDRPAIQTGMKLIENHSQFIVLAGESQSGKSVAAGHLAVEAKSRGRKIVARYACDPGEAGAYPAVVDGVPFGHYVRDVTAEIGQKPLHGTWVDAPSAFDCLLTRNFWAKIESAEILILDDLGLGPQSEALTSRLVGMLVKRHNNNLPTVITTNMSLAQFRDQFGSGPGERIITRLGRGWIQVG